MQKIAYHVGSSALEDLIHSLCPIDAHIHVTMRGVWSDGSGIVVRAFSIGINTYWTRETWVRGNGWTCTLEVLTKAEFLKTIR